MQQGPRRSPLVTRSAGRHSPQLGSLLLGLVPALVRSLAAALQRLSRSGTAREVARHLDAGLAQRVLLDARSRHPLAPAAVRIERSRAQKRRSAAGQVAVTVWFGEGPALPSPSSAATARRHALRVGAGVLSAAAIAVVTTAAARLGAAREVSNLEMADRPRLGPPSE